MEILEVKKIINKNKNVLEKSTELIIRKKCLSYLKMYRQRKDENEEYVRYLQDTLKTVTSVEIKGQKT